MTTDILNRADLAQARFHFYEACSFSIAHGIAAPRALEQYGEHGALISGCVRVHFPADVKEHLRGLAQDVTKASNAAWAAKPARVRDSTMRKLSRACAANGHGFYGPQP